MYSTYLLQALFVEINRVGQAGSCGAHTNIRLKCNIYQVQ